MFSGTRTSLLVSAAQHVALIPDTAVPNVVVVPLWWLERHTAQ